MTEQEQSECQHNVLPLGWSSWPVEPTQQYLSTTLPRSWPVFYSYENSQPDLSHYHLPPPDFSSTNQQYSDEPETLHHGESQNQEGSIIELSSSKYPHLKEEERFILEARLRQEPWKVTKEAYKKHFGALPYASDNALNMKVSRLKGKHPEIKAMLEKGNPSTKVARSVKRTKRRTALTSGADDDTAAANNGEDCAQQLSLAEAIRAAQTLLYVLGGPDLEGLVAPDDCMALIRIFSQLNQLNRLNQ